ncbi:expressed unknown protein [Seminavis robusta]|uniref:Uncharacterized protein n=1 Tax=Seminavis robusta TaxID=568900 RepID=A0A9N8HPM5_9STRA|nr:expressed unknown protein [Seminavis robusta]|eukprot:Sro1084_g239460.1 n/a (245) ;mRNA; r:7499-8233
MKSTILASALVALALVVDSVSADYYNVSSKESSSGLFGGYPTQTNSITLVTEYGEIPNYASFTTLMESKLNRKLQTSGQGFGNDPTACSADGVRFTCIAPSEYSAGGNETKITNTITCDLNDQIGTNFQESDNCICNSLLEQEIVNSTATRTRNCACGVCPQGSAQAISLDCSVVEDDPYVAGTCKTIDCDGRCNGGNIVVNVPTAAPVAEGGDNESSWAVIGTSTGTTAILAVVSAVWMMMMV